MDSITPVILAGSLIAASTPIIHQQQIATLLQQQLTEQTMRLRAQLAEAFALDSITNLTDWQQGEERE